MKKKLIPKNNFANTVEGFIFVTRHYILGLPVSDRSISENNPVGLVFLPFGRFQCGVATPYRALLFLPLTRHHDAYRNYNTARAQRPLQRAANNSPAQRRTRQTHGARFAPFAPGFSAKEKAGFNSLSP